MSKYTQYKSIKLTLGGLTYKGYPLSRVCGSQLAMLVWKPSFYLTLSYLSVGVKGLFDRLNGAAVNGMLMTYSTQRDDYLDLMKRFFPKGQPIYVRPQSCWYPRWRDILACIESLIKAIALVKLKFGWCLGEYLKAVIAVAFVIRLIDEIEKNDIRCTQYVAFNSSYLAESVLAWYFRLRGVETVSLQHGMYAKYVSREIPMDVINYENVCADQIWLWGEYTFLQIQSFLPSDCTPVIKGYPVVPHKASKVQAVDAIYVLLPRNIYLSQSFELLDMLKSYSYLFIIRPHPSALAGVRNWMAQNSQHNFTLEESGTIALNMAYTRYFRVISFNSTAIFEAILARQKIIVFNKDGEFDYDGMPLFEDEAQLDSLLVQEPKALSANYYYSNYDCLGSGVF